MPNCQVCGYAIRALQKPVCPECGARLDHPESIRLPVERRQLLWAVGCWAIFVLNATAAASHRFGIDPAIVWFTGAAAFVAGATYMLLRWRAVRPEAWDVDGEEPMWLDRTDRCLVLRGRSYSSRSE